MSRASVVTRVGDGVYRVDVDGRSHIVYVAGSGRDRWAFWNGQVFRGDLGQSDDGSSRTGRAAARHGAQTLSAPMPATVLKVQVKPGDAVRKGDVLVVLEAMKMELPLRATGDAIVAAVDCREGELVQADAALIELQ